MTGKDENLSIWKHAAKPPKHALSRINGGRLGGKTSINPQWRLGVLTELFGPVGFGWRYTIDRLWTEPGSDGQVAAFAQIGLHVKQDQEWSDAIIGVGGSMLVVNEKSGPHTSDECYKMAITDAISVACKQLGIAADIYFDRWDGDKYKTEATNPRLRKNKRPTEHMCEAMMNQLWQVFGDDLQAQAEYLMDWGQNVATINNKWDIAGAVRAIPDKGSMEQMCKKMTAMHTGMELDDEDIPA